MGNTKRASRCSASLSLGLVGTVLFLVLGSGAMMAEDSHVAYLPMIFRAEGQGIRTTACLQVNESTYSQDGWWQDSAKSDGAPERALKAVLAAMQHKDRAALLRLADPVEAKDPKGYDEQASAFFQQFEKLEILAVPRAYEFDGLAVFFLRLRTPQKVAFVPLLFAREQDGSFGFLPHRTRLASYRLVQDWFDSAWGPAKSGQPAYCTETRSSGRRIASHWRLPLIH